RIALPSSVHEPALQALLLFGAGVLLGPIAGILDGNVLRAMTPLAALLVGWIGASEAARFAPRSIMRMRDHDWQRAALVTMGIIVAVALAAWLGARRNPRLAAWQPAGAVALALGAIAAITPVDRRSRIAAVPVTIAFACALLSLALIRP